MCWFYFFLPLVCGVRLLVNRFLFIVRFYYLSVSIYYLTPSLVFLFSFLVRCFFSFSKCYCSCTTMMLLLFFRTISNCTFKRVAQTHTRQNCVSLSTLEIMCDRVYSVWQWLFVAAFVLFNSCPMFILKVFSRRRLFLWTFSISKRLLMIKCWLLQFVCFRVRIHCAMHTVELSCNVISLKKIMVNGEKKRK